jgi:hypothetical protein
MIALGSMLLRERIAPAVDGPIPGKAFMSS